MRANGKFIQIQITICCANLYLLCENDYQVWFRFRCNSFYYCKYRRETEKKATMFWFLMYCFAFVSTLFVYIACNRNDIIAQYDCFASFVVFVRRLLVLFRSQHKVMNKKTTIKWKQKINDKSASIKLYSSVILRLFRYMNEKRNFSIIWVNRFVSAYT